MLQLLRDLRRELGLALILVTHNLALVAELCDRVLVMYAGRLVEEAGIYDLFERPSHPYTAQLLRAIPRFPAQGERLYTLPGNVPDLAAAPRGCPFAPRCERVVGPVCQEQLPRFLPSGREQYALCHWYDEAVVGQAVAAANRHPRRAESERAHDRDRGAARARARPQAALRGDEKPPRAVAARPSGGLRRRWGGLRDSLGARLSA
ncbi:MAG: hypothetical protein KatS3mg061_2995 [Dehalococcoidia bacterium]|nr:MAG: hypothetical protein KatS3mg061_2995 [Dehalococcoidia bacterium]